MNSIVPYLFYSGRCEEAIEFYRSVLGAQLVMQMRFQESPVPVAPEMIQAGFESKIMHAELRIGEAHLLLSDGCDDRSKFEGFRLTLQCDSEGEARRAFDGLADGGTVETPLNKTFFSPCYGMVTDRFRVGWMVMVPGPPGGP